MCFCVRAHVCTHIGECEYICIFVCFVCVCVCVCVCVYVCVCVCVCVCLHAFAYVYVYVFGCMVWGGEERLRIHKMSS